MSDKTLQSARPLTRFELFQRTGWPQRAQGPKVVLSPLSVKADPV
jgi:hypothetical protein